MQRSGVSLASAVLAVALALPRTVVGQADEVVHPVDAIGDAMTSPCTCDCCQVATATPGEETQTDSGKKLSKYCDTMGVLSDSCPAKTCNVPTSDKRLFLAAVEEDIDYTRYCSMFCYPVFSQVGSVCAKVDLGDVKRIATPDGNGKVVLHSAPAASDDEGKFDGGSLSSSEVEAQAKQAAEAAKVDQEVLWDMRKLIGERLRAESGAHVSRGFASMAHTQASEYGTNRQAVLAGKVAQAVSPLQGTIATALNRAEAAAGDATDTAASTRAVLLVAKAEAAKVAAETQRLAIAEVRRQAAAAAKREADAEVILRAWDKPPSWPRVLGVRAADPYLHAMVGAIQRTSEYDGYAKGLLGQAKGAQGKAAALTKEMNLEEAHGDKIAAEINRHQITGLLARSKALQSEADKFWKIAESTRKTIPEWQIAGTHAAAHTAWEFALAITPEPSFL